MSLITGLLITGLDWTGLDWNRKTCFMHCGMQLLQIIILSFSIFCVSGMHSNCSTIRAGDQLRNYTSEKAMVFSMPTRMMPILLLGINVYGYSLECVIS